MVTYNPTWLMPVDVLTWIRAAAPTIDTPEADELNRVVVMTELYVQRCRPDAYTDAVPPAAPVYVPDAEVYNGAVMYAARILRRRNSPAGVESFGDLGATFVAKWDADIERALRVGGSQVPGFG